MVSSHNFRDLEDSKLEGPNAEPHTQTLIAFKYQKARKRTTGQDFQLRNRRRKLMNQEDFQGYFSRIDKNGLREQNG